MNRVLLYLLSFSLCLVIANGKELKNVWFANGQSLITYSMDFSTDGEKLFANCMLQDNFGKRYVIQQWDVQTKTLEKLINADGYLLDICVSKDKNSLLATNVNNAYLIDLTTGQKRSINFQYGYMSILIDWLSFSNDDSKIFLHEYEFKKIQIFDAKTLDSLDVIDVGDPALLCNSHDRKFLGVVNNIDTTFSVWSLDSKTKIRAIKLSGANVQSASFSFDMEKVVLTFYSIYDTLDNIKVYSLETGEILKSYKSGLPEPYSIFLQDNQTIITGAYPYSNGIVCNLNEDSCRKTDIIVNGPYLKASPINNAFAVKNYEGVFDVYSELNFTPKFSNKPTNYTNLSYMNNFIISKDEKIIYTCGNFWNKGFIQKRNLETGELIGSYKISDTKLNSICMSEDETKIVVCDDGGNVILLDNQNGTISVEKRYKFIMANKSIYNVLISNDNKKIFASGNRTGIFYINVENDMVKILDTTNIYYTTMILKKDASKLIFGAYNKHIGVMEYQSATDIYKRTDYFLADQSTSYSSGISEIGFSNDESMFYVCASDYNSYLYNTETLEKIKTFSAGEKGWKSNQVITACLNNDKSKIIVFDSYPSCRIYDVNNSSEIWYDDSLSTKYNFSNYVTSVKFCKNDNYFLASCYDGSIGLFDISEITAVDDLTSLNENINVYPNPAELSVTIDLYLNKRDNVEIEIIALNGSLIKSIFNGYMPEGSQKIEWNCSSVAKGIYFCKVSSNSFSGVKKIIVNK